MAGGCCGGDEAAPTDKVDPIWRRALWIALVINAGMFLAEMAAGVAGGSKSLQADALDFLGDAANYAISLGVVGLAMVWRARPAMLKGMTIFLFERGVIASALWSAVHGLLPHAEMMGVVGFAALIANVAVAAMLFRYRSGDANMRSVWICSRNDAVGNVAVMLAALGVFGTGSAWPDLLVALIMACLGISGGAQIISQARDEPRDEEFRRQSPPNRRRTPPLTTNPSVGAQASTVHAPLAVRLGNSNGS